MKIRISNDWWQHYVREQVGSTQAEKECNAERIWSGKGRQWAKSMGETIGKWIDVETKFLFEDQFNVDTMRIMAKHIDAIQFGPEFKDIEEFNQAVQTRYDKDWPGSKVKCSILRSYIKSGFITVE